MSPNIGQILSIVRWLLSVGGPVGALLISRGMPAEQVTALQGSVIALIGALPPIIAFVWSMFAHTDTAALKAVEAMPDVQQIVPIPVPKPEGAVAVAVDDPNREKVGT